jgi:hypothetical protein
MGHSAYSSFGDSGMFLKCSLDLGGINVLTPRDYQVATTVQDVEIPFGI